MKRAYVLLLALLLILAGCAGKKETNDISVKDVCCPYEIVHKNDGVEITLQDGEKRGVLWSAEVIPGDICRVTPEECKAENTCIYRVTGEEEGVAQLTFTAVQPDEAVAFVLTLEVRVDANGKAVVASCRHQQREENSEEVNGLKYKWNVDVDGILHFSFINSEDRWSVRNNSENICTLTEAMSTPSGCRFSARANTPGETTVVLVGEVTLREVSVVLRVDADGALSILSVGEK